MVPEMVAAELILKRNIADKIMYFIK